MPKKYDKSEKEPWLHSELPCKLVIEGSANIEYFKKLEKKPVTKKEVEASYRQFVEMFGYELAHKILEEYIPSGSK